MTGCVQVSTTLDDETTARKLAAALVEERLAACVQISGPLFSVYRWQGAVQEATEWLCVAKTAAERLPRLLTRIKALHPYQQPELIVVDIAAGDPAYIEWLREASLPPEELA